MKLTNAINLTVYHHLMEKNIQVILQFKITLTVRLTIYQVKYCFMNFLQIIGYKKNFLSLNSYSQTSNTPSFIKKQHINKGCIIDKTLQLWEKHEIFILDQ